MPFKIVQTVEKGRRTLSVVWEEHGKLFWPSEILQKRQVTDEYPGPNWDILDWVVKRNNYQTYIAAEHDIQMMEIQTNTVNESPDTLNRSARVNNFENTAHNDNLRGSSFQADNDMKTDETLKTSQLIKNQTLLLQKINNQYKIINMIVENMQKLNQTVTTLSTQINESLAKIADRIDQPMAVTLVKENDQEDSELRFEHIDNKEQLDNIESSLSDKTFRAKLQQKLSFLFQPCEGNGLTFSYKLLDSMISRRFLCHCSWSGGSRCNISKIPLKDYKNFIDFFCNMIRTWDSTFTLGDTEKFLKSVTRNSLKRMSSKNLRSSSKRVRKCKSSQNLGIKETKSESALREVFIAISNDDSPNDEENELDNIKLEHSSAMVDLEENSDDDLDFD